jgi:hypothetical protein
MLKIFLLLTCLILPFFAYAEGGEVGNGGTGIYCNSPVDGSAVLFSTDSVLMRNQRFYENRLFESTISFNKFFIDKLTKTLPSLAHSFQEFLKIMKKKKGPFLTKQYLFWQEGSPKATNDQEFKVNFPSNCLNLVTRQPTIKQIVGRYNLDLSRGDRHGSKNLEKILYISNSEMVEELRKNGDELSWLIVHEWLWYYVESIENLRLVNTYLHSYEFFNADSDTVIMEELNLLGFSQRKRIISVSLLKAASRVFDESMPKLNKLLESYNRISIDDFFCKLESKKNQIARKIGRIVQFYREKHSYYYALQFLSAHPTYNNSEFLSEKNFAIYKRAEKISNKIQSCH